MTYLELMKMGETIQSQAEEIKRLRASLELIADIAEGSRTVNSLPHIANIARGLLVTSKRDTLAGWRQ